MNFPKNFEIQMKKLLGEDYNLYLDSFNKKPVRALRINEAKITVDGFLSLRQKYHMSDMEGVSWTRNGFYVPENEEPSKHPFYFAGLYYIQDPPAMAPAALLPISPGDRVLDLCAAPGGKATELAARLALAEKVSPGESGILIANDISSGRASALRKNIERFGLKNTCVTVESPERLSTLFPEYFDKILVDAPCSGEGMFHSDPSMLREWERKGPDYYVPRQKDILERAYKMLAPGGLMMYSTCTYSYAEDEGQVEKLLISHPELEMVGLPEDEHFSHLIMPDGRKSRCVRIYPHKSRGGGQFLALIKKRGRDIAEDRINKRKIDKSRRDGQERRIVKNGEVYLLPGGAEILPGIRYALTGLDLGKIRNGTLRPSQGYAMTLHMEEWPDVIDLNAGDARAMKYLKGETIEIPLKGGGQDHNLAKQTDTLVTVDGFPLGFGRRNKNLLKNGLNPGWRML